MQRRMEMTTFNRREKEWWWEAEDKKSGDFDQGYNLND